MNLDTDPRNDFVAVDANLSPAGQKMVNLLVPGKQVTVEERGQRHAVRIPLDGYEMAIFKWEKTFR
ncbi:MAG: hypothetical protein KAU60_11705 [Desulfobacterales bacterium]|nr:hypothetical protein [Desulfobacterales bacterium]